MAVWLVGIPAYAKYGGGSGTSEDPYQIATAADLIAPDDHGKDVDLVGIFCEKVLDKSAVHGLSCLVSPC
jgi:hypothetical protein